MYRLELSRTAHKQIVKLPAQAQDRINSAVARLAENPRPEGSIKLTVSDGYRLRVGDYRILYQINDGEKSVVVYRVMSRGSVYRF